MAVIRNILGIDPGLKFTGWGVIRQTDNRLGFVAAGRIAPKVDLPMAERLRVLAQGLAAVIAQHLPNEAAIEETFVNNNPLSALKLGQARGVGMLVAAQAGLPVAEYAATTIKQAVTGHGHAEKEQVQAMIKVLLPGSGVLPPDAADALAVAICHAHSSKAGATKGGGR